MDATVLGRRFETVEITAPDSFAAPAVAVESLLVGRRLDRVGRRGKLLILDLGGGDDRLNL